MSKYVFVLVTVIGFFT